MKRYLFVPLVLLTVLLFSSLSNPNENIVQVQTKDTKVPGWQWTSGEVEMEQTASKESFKITFDPTIYHPRDSVKITFSSYKVTLGNLANGTAFKNWLGKISLVRFINNNWIPLVADTNDRINMPFSGRNNIIVDSLYNYSINVAVPLSRTYLITASAISLVVDNKQSSLVSSGGKSGATLAVSIKGIEVEKIVRN